MASNLLTSYPGGETALSVTMTAVTSLASIVTVPLVVFVAHDHFVGVAATAEMSTTGVSLRMLAIVALPVGLGMAVRGLRPALAARWEPAAGILSGVLFAVVLVAAIWVERENIATYFAAAGLATLALNVAIMAIAFWGTILIGCLLPQRIALALECGLQNGTLAITVVAALGLDPAYAVPAAIYSLLMFVTALRFAAVVRGRKGAASARAA